MNIMSIRYRYKTQGYEEAGLIHSVINYSVLVI